jgi:hypothetical protein
MAERTLRLYDSALAASPANVSNTLPKPLAADRVRDALGYVPWTPPAPLPPSLSRPLPAAEPQVELASPPAGMVTRVSRWALRWRHTFPGRVLYRLTPTTILEALKSRLY